MEADRHRIFEQTWSSAPGVRGWFAEVNNQPLGKRFMVTALAFFFIGGVLALLMRLQLASGELQWIGPDRFNQIFTMHGSTMMYLFAVPFLEGLAVYLLPMMLGSRDAAYPRLTAFSYWTYLFGGILFYSSFLVGTVPDAGWFAYTPLSGPKYSGLGVDFWLLGLSLVEVAGIAAAIDVVATILKLRAPGMKLGKMPLFVWTLLVSGVMILFAFTVLLTATLLLELDRTAGTKFFDPSAGGNSLLWQHLFWFFGHPEVYIMFLPATGIVSMVVATAARRPVAAYHLVVVAIMLIGFVSFGLWVHHMFTTGLPDLAMGFFTAASLMIGVASGIQIFSWVATVWGARPTWSPAFLWIAGFFVIFILGGLTGVMVAVVPFDLQVHDTYFIVAHFHYVLIGGVVFPIFAVLHHWFPKITGRMVSPRLAKWSFWLTFAGFNATFFPMHAMGLMGLPRRVYTYSSALGLDGINLLASSGALVMAAGSVVMVWNFIQGYRHGIEADSDPWGGETLEWSIGSPPPPYLFSKPPEVSHRSPLWYEAGATRWEREREAMDTAPVKWRATLITDALNAVPQGIHYLPGPTLVPLMAALGLTVAMVGLLTKLYLLVPLGLVFLGGSLGRWLYPDKERIEMLRRDGISRRSGLPVFTEGAASCGWWGAVMTLTVIGMGFGALFFCYFYLWLFSERWPQEDLPLPDTLTALVASASAAAGWTSARLGKNRWAGMAGAALGAAIAAVALTNGTIRLPFSCDANAYASTVHVLGWALAGVMTTAAILAGVSAVRGWRGRDDPREEHDNHFRIACLFVGFAAALSAAVHGITIGIPRLL